MDGVLAADIARSSHEQAAHTSERCRELAVSTVDLALLRSGLLSRGLVALVNLGEHLVIPFVMLIAPSCLQAREGLFPRCSRVLLPPETMEM
jgi:hypothetical protein